MTIRILWIVFLGTCLSPAMAQSASISGTVSQVDNPSPLSGVYIYLEGTDYGTISNGAGRYALRNLPAGTYTLKASSVGYVTFEQKVTLAAEEGLTINLELVEGISKLQEVVVMSNGYTGLRDVPGSVQYLSPKELQRFNYTDINRTLRAVPGVNIQEEDGFGLRPNIGLRGTGVERSGNITVMEDGVLMAPAPYAAPAAYHFPTVGRMHAVEILKGSSQIRYGPYTTGGAINLISTPIPEELSGRVSMLGGSFGSRNLHAFVGNSHEQVAYMVETFQYGADGFKELDNGGDTGFNKEEFLAKVRVNTKATAKVYQSLTFKIGQLNEVSDMTYLGLTESDFEATPYRRYAGSQVDQMNTQQRQFSLTHLARFSDAVRLRTTAYRSEFARNWYKLDRVKDGAGNRVKIDALLGNPGDFAAAYGIVTGTSSPNDDALEVKANNREYYAQGVQTELGIDFTTGNLTHNVIFGLRYHEDEIDRFQWVDKYRMDDGTMKLTDAGQPGTESNRIGSASALASYLQYQLKYGQWTFTPGLRYENVNIARADYGKEDPDRSGSDLSERSNDLGAFMPGFAVDYRFQEGVNIFAGVHKGFAPPGSKDGALPEESVNYELGLRYRKSAFSAEVIGFFNDYSNLLGADLNAAGGGGSGQLFNGGEVETMGLEVQASLDLLSGTQRSFNLPLTLVYTYTDATFKNDFDSDNGAWGTVAAGDAFPYLANHQLAAVLGLEHRRFGVNLSARFVDEMRTRPGQSDIPANELIDNYWVADASASYRLQRNIDLFTSITNLTDEVYGVARRPAGLRPGMPRAFLIGMRANF